MTLVLPALPGHRSYISILARVIVKHHQISNHSVPFQNDYSILEGPTIPLPPMVRVQSQ